MISDSTRVQTADGAWHASVYDAPCDAVVVAVDGYQGWLDLNETAGTMHRWLHTADRFVIDALAEHCDTATEVTQYLDYYMGCYGSAEEWFAENDIAEADWVEFCDIEFVPSAKGTLVFDFKAEIVL